MQMYRRFFIVSRKASPLLEQFICLLPTLCFFHHVKMKTLEGVTVQLAETYNMKDVIF